MPSCLVSPCGCMSREYESFVLAALQCRIALLCVNLQLAQHCLYDRPWGLYWTYRRHSNRSAAAPVCQAWCMTIVWQQSVVYRVMCCDTYYCSVCWYLLVMLRQQLCSLQCMRLTANVGWAGRYGWCCLVSDISIPS